MDELELFEKAQAWHAEQRAHPGFPLEAAWIAGYKAALEDFPSLLKKLEKLN